MKVAKSASVKGKNAPAKKEAKIEAEPEAKTVNPEAEKKAKDMEAKRKRAENLARQGLKLPSYSGADKEEWGKKADDYSAFINELIQNSANAEVGFRKINEQSIHYDLLFTCQDLKKIIQEPQWPDPDNEPLPPPLIMSI